MEHGFDSDDATAEFLIQRLPLRDVLEFVNAREAVRAIPTSSRIEASFFLLPRDVQTASTMRVPGAYVAEPDPFPATKTAA